MSGVGRDLCGSSSPTTKLRGSIRKVISSSRARIILQLLCWSGIPTRLTATLQETLANIRQSYTSYGKKANLNQPVMPRYNRSRQMPAAIHKHFSTTNICVCISLITWWVKKGVVLVSSLVMGSYRSFVSPRSWTYLVLNSDANYSTKAKLKISGICL